MWRTACDESIRGYSSWRTKVVYESGGKRGTYRSAAHGTHKNQQEINKQLNLGNNGLLVEDQYLTVINLGDMEKDVRTWHEYWPLANQAARQAKVLMDKARAANTIDTG